jgi:hypothetical protein
MVSIIDKNTTEEQLKAAFRKVQSKRGVNALKYCGTIKLKESPVSIQKKMRNEWK